jgi:hypothetical protein
VGAWKREALFFPRAEPPAFKITLKDLFGFPASGDAAGRGSSYPADSAMVSKIEQRHEAAAGYPQPQQNSLTDSRAALTLGKPAKEMLAKRGQRHDDTECLASTLQ